MVKGRCVAPDYRIKGRGHRAPFGVVATIRGWRLKNEAWVLGGDYSRAMSDRGNTVCYCLPLGENISKIG